MAVGDSAVIAPLSYLAVGRETASGTYNTCTARLDFISASLKTLKERKILEEIETSRTYGQQIGMNKVVEGDVEFYACADHNAHNYILQNAFGGAITSATSTGETAGGTAWTHTIEIGNFDQSYSSLCLNQRKGDSASGFIFEYNGARVNEITYSAELEEALKVNASMIMFDSTKTSNDVSAVLDTQSTSCPLSFVNGRFSVESTFASLTSSSFWHVQKVEFVLTNNLKNDNDSRRIGSDVLQVLPPGIANFGLQVDMRFDTTTARDAMLNGTQFSAEFEFLGDTLNTSVIRRGIKFAFPRVYISDAGDPEIGGPDEQLKQTVVFSVLRDLSSSTGYACQALVTNNTASY